MIFLKSIHQLLAFLLELAMLGALGLWGFRTGKSAVAAWLLGIGLPLLVAVLWGIGVAPRSAYRLPMPYRALLILGLFTLAAYLLFQTGYARSAMVFAGLAVVSTLLTFFIPE